MQENKIKIFESKQVTGIGNKSAERHKRRRRIIRGIKDKIQKKHKGRTETTGAPPSGSAADARPFRFCLFFILLSFAKACARLRQA